MLIARADDLDPGAVLRIARAGVVPVLAPELLRELDARRALMLAALTDGRLVYGVNTGMGALSQHRLDADAQSRHQEALMLARAAGGPPWLSRDEVRAMLAVRLRTFLTGDAGVSAALCQRLAELLAGDTLPEIPRGSTGVAGEIIGMAHLGLAVGPLGPKEGVALLEGVPTATALSILLAADARVLLRQACLVLAAEFALTGAARDVFDPRLARGDDVLARVTGFVRDQAGTPSRPRALQPPVSFRVTPQVVALCHRTMESLESAVDRALCGVTDSPAFFGDSQDFVGSAGFYGYDLAAHLHALTVALVGVAELGATRLHRMMNPAVTGLTAQLSADPGPHTGLSTVHKRAIGVTHGLRRHAFPATVGPVEASAGQEDVQAFALEAAEACRAALDGAREVLACELLAVHQARCLGATLPPDAGASLVAVLDAVAEVLPATAADRPFGRDVELLLGLAWDAADRRP